MSSSDIWVKPFVMKKAFEVVLASNQDVFRLLGGVKNFFLGIPR